MMGGGGGFHGVWRAGRPTQQVKISRAMLVRIVRYFRPYWREAALVLTTVAAIAALGLVPPLLLRAIIDVAIPERDLTLLLILAVSTLLAPTLSGLLGVG